MNHCPIVSIIIPAYNASSWIAEAIESVFSQSFMEYEIIVVDDGSKDNTHEVLQKYIGRIRVIKQPNSGQAAARNKGIENSSGKYVAFLDADDVWLPKKLEYQISLIKSNPSLGLVFGDMYFFNERLTQKKTYFQFYPPKRGSIFKDLFIQDFIPTSTVLVRRSCLSNVGNFDISLHGLEDYDLWLRIAKDCDVDFLPFPVAKYRTRQGQTSSNIEQMLFQFLIVQERTFYQNLQSFSDLKGWQADRAWYNRILKLAIVHIENRERDKALERLLEYKKRRGASPLLGIVFLLWLLPVSISSYLVRTLNKYKQNSDYAQW